MKHGIRYGVALTLAIGGMAAPAQAQGGFGGLLGSLLPDVKSVGASNAAGVLTYCMKNKLLNSTSGVRSVLGQLTGEPEVKQSDGFKLGELGTLQTDGVKVPLNSIKGKLRNSMCDMVLKHARSFL